MRRRPYGAGPLAEDGCGCPGVQAEVLMRFLVYRRCVGATFAQTIGGIMAFAALSMVITVATLRASIGLSSAWHRTSKFRAHSDWRSALAGARSEAALGGTCLTVALGLFVLAPGNGGVVVMLGIASAAKGITFLTSPVLALVADRDLPRPVTAAARESTLAEAAP